MRRILVGVLLLGACSSNKPVAPKDPAQPIVHSMSAGALDSLPRMSLTSGRLICLVDAGAPCPTTPATANWLRDGKYATWELRKAVEIWSPDKTDPQLLGEVGVTDSQYDIVLSAAATRSGYIILNLSPGRSSALLYDSRGRYTSNLPMPPVSMTKSRGYSGNVAFFQLIHEAGRDSAAEFDVREVDGPGDTIGVSVLKARLPWLRIRDGRATGPLPLFPTLPSYALAADSDIVWGNSDLFNFERRSPTGAIRWKLTTDAPGPPITKAELAAIRAKLPQNDKTKLAGFDSSAAHTGNFFPAASGLFVGPDGRVLVAGPQLPTRDSVEYVLLDRTGLPTGRLGMPKLTRPLLFAGDSVLVQRAGANANQELRWLVIGKP